MCFVKLGLLSLNALPFVVDTVFTQGEWCGYRTGLDKCGYFFDFAPLDIFFFPPRCKNNALT